MQYSFSAACMPCMQGSNSCLSIAIRLSSYSYIIKNLWNCVVAESQIHASTIPIYVIYMHDYSLCG